MVAYSLDIELPKHVWDHPTMQEMSRAIVDILAWTNVRFPLSISFRSRSADVNIIAGALLIQCVLPVRSTGRHSNVLAHLLPEGASERRFPQPRIRHYARARLRAPNRHRRPH